MHVILSHFPDNLVMVWLRKPDDRSKGSERAEYMFSSRLDELIQYMGAKNGQVAKLAGFDRTNISRLRSSGRLPKKNSPTIRKLVTGLYLYADNRNELEKLCGYINADPDRSAEEITDKIRDWLYEGEPEDGRKTVTDPARPQRTGKPKPVFRFFGERLSAVMKLTELSNARLSHAIHMDTSMISRFRTGVRTPVPGSDVTKRISSVLYNRVKISSRQDDLAKLMDIPVSMMDEDALHEWLFDSGNVPDREAGIAEDLLGSFDSLSAEIQLSLPAPGEAVPPEIIHSEETEYYSREGIRNAVLRFLYHAWNRKAELLLLYSDEDQEWLTGDRNFLMRWASLMSACVKNGTRIRIIHNVDRDLAEMTDAIRNWLPLYMSGMVESWYSTLKRNPRFSHTLFLCPDTACIEAFHPAGTETSGVYHYYTGQQILEARRSGFESMLKTAGPLLKVPAAPVYDGVSDITIIQSSLSVATMPEELVKAFNVPALYENWKTLHEALLYRLEKAKVNECVTLADDEDLFSGKVRIEQLNEIRELCYTPEQYAMHIRNIIRLSELYPDYRFYALPEIPFPNMKLMIADDMTSIIHANRPDLSFGVTHPLMCRAFRSYAESLMEQHRMDRNTLRKILEAKYL